MSRRTGRGVRALVAAAVVTCWAAGSAAASQEVMGPDDNAPPPAGVESSDGSVGSPRVAVPRELRVDVDPRPNAGPVVVLDGHGNGHGIGLSQWGALGYAVDHGWDAARILDHYYGGTIAGRIDDSEISVRLVALDDAQTVVVHGRGAATWLGDPARRSFHSLVAREIGPGVYRVWGRADPRCPPADAPLDDPASGWVVVGASVAGPVVFAPTTDTTRSADLSDLLAVCEPAGTVRSYRGRIRAVNGTDGENRTVNDVPIEQYLRGVVPSEVAASWAGLGGGRGIEAIVAQAVAARSYAATQRRYSYARTCDTQACQVYSGAGRRASAGGAPAGVEQPETDIAIGASAGVVRLVGVNGPIANTMFSSSSGGWTAPSSSPGFPAVADEGDDFAMNPHHNWSVAIPTAAFEQAWPAIGRFLDLTVTRRNGLGADGGRVLGAIVHGDGGQVVVTGDEVRRALGLRSNWFSPRTACGGRDAPPSTRPAPSAPGLGFRAVVPTRVIDTRSAIGTVAEPVKAGCTLLVPLAPPTGAAAVAVTITATGAQGAGYITAYPCGTPQPDVSAVQVLGGVDVPGTTVVALSADATICLFTSVTLDLIVDVAGWLGPVAGGFGDRVMAAAPRRLLDTRQPSPALPLAAGTVTRVPRLEGLTDASAISVNITATAASAAGFVTAFPCAEGRPNASVLNYRVGVDVANHAFVRLDGQGEWCMFNSAEVHLVVDVDGVFTAATVPSVEISQAVRRVDSRTNVGTNGPWSAGEVRALDLGDAGDLWFELTVVDPRSAGYVSVYPCDAARAETSVINAIPATNVANLVITATDRDGRVCVFTSMTTHLLIDAIGYAPAG